MVPECINPCMCGTWLDHSVMLFYRTIHHSTTMEQSVTINQLVANMKYEFQVSATNILGASAFSESTTTSTPKQSKYF